MRSKNLTKYIGIRLSKSDYGLLKNVVKADPSCESVSDYIRKAATEKAENYFLQLHEEEEGLEYDD